MKRSYSFYDRFLICFVIYILQVLGNRVYGVMHWIIPILVACSSFGAANGGAFSGGRYEDY